MALTSLSTAVRSVRLRYAVPFVLLLVAAYSLGVRPWMTNWGSTAAEQQMALPGDDLNPAAATLSTMALTIDAPPAVVWQWLVQIGQDRAGFYSYTWLENLIGADIHNANVIHPEWQRLAVGDGWRTVPADYLGGVGKDAVSRVLMIDPGRVLVVEMFGAHVIMPVDARTSRLIVRGQATPPGLITTGLVEPLVFTLERRMLLGLKDRAEGRADSPGALQVIAQIGWAAAGVAVAGLFVSRRRRLYWLALPVAAALPALLMGHDAEAGLAAFIAAGISVLGFLIFGRDWLGSYLIIAALVLLTLLLAPDAHIALGFAFAVMALAALGAIVATRSGANVGAPGRLVTPTR